MVNINLCVDVAETFTQQFDFVDTQFKVSVNLLG